MNKTRYTCTLVAATHCADATPHGNRSEDKGHQRRGDSVNMSIVCVIAAVRNLCGGLSDNAIPSQTASDLSSTDDSDQCFACGSVRKGNEWEWKSAIGSFFV